MQTGCYQRSEEPSLKANHNAIALNFSEQWILVLIKRNGMNGPLTTIKAIQTIQAETGLTQAEILEDDAKVIFKPDTRKLSTEKAASELSVPKAAITKKNP